MGGVYIPNNYFSFPLEGADIQGEWMIYTIGAPYATLRAALREIGQTVGCTIRGFGDMAAEEVAQRTGLTLAEATLAKECEFDEPFLVEEDEALVKLVWTAAEARGFRCTRGGDFFISQGTMTKDRQSDGSWPTTAVVRRRRDARS